MPTAYCQEEEKQAGEDCVSYNILVSFFKKERGYDRKRAINLYIWGYMFIRALTIKKEAHQTVNSGVKYYTTGKKKYYYYGLFISVFDLLK